MAAVTGRPESESTYLDYLPAVFRGGAAPGEPDSSVATCAGSSTCSPAPATRTSPGSRSGSRGFRPQVSQRSSDTSKRARTVPTASERRRTSCRGLPGWVALALRSDLDELRRRELIARAVPLYRLRGTKVGLEQLVGVYTRMGVTVAELGDRFQLGVNSRVGVDTVLGGGAPHFFRVVVRLPTTDPAEIAAQRRLITAIVDAEKPAYSHYTLDVETPTLQIGVTSTVGVDTLLGAESE